MKDGLIIALMTAVVSAIVLQKLLPSKDVQSGGYRESQAELKVVAAIALQNGNEVNTLVCSRVQRNHPTLDDLSLLVTVEGVKHWFLCDLDKFSASRSPNRGKI